MVRIVLMAGALLVASSACGGDDGDDAPSDVDAGATEEQTPSPDDDGAPPEESDEESATGAGGAACYAPMGITGPTDEFDGPDDEETSEPEATVMGNITVAEVGAELESILVGIDGLACPEFPEGMGLGYGESLFVLDDDGVATDADSELWVSLDGDSDDPSEYADELMTVCEELSSFLAEHEDAVGTASIDVDFGVDPGYDYEPALRNDAVTPGDPGTCTAA